MYQTTVPIIFTEPYIYNQAVFQQAFIIKLLFINIIVLHMMHCCMCQRLS